ncbi:PREDICTED: uncharacterized protein LOC105566410 isoform X2 [Vollenhovia emeryi]|uniref:uncharacterized protein LOC105566410 isoform X2 n=1 Tax=Vollenhovia emeryi TaxID=411798 RepID=UPI0005F3C1C1|nr:PREDICTED: uncharacterized protein LOC105566410 isoform X2 [Vollenhovia emeryi]
MARTPGTSKQACVLPREPKQMSSTTLRSRLFVAKRLCCCRRNSSTRKDDEERVDRAREDSIDDLAEPTNCCMSGCANCVWIRYAERLSSAMERSDVDLQRTILEKVQDPNMRAFLAMELRCRKLTK